MYEGAASTISRCLALKELTDLKAGIFNCANEQSHLGHHWLRLLLTGASVPSRQMRLLREQYAPTPGASSGEEPIVHAEGEECGLVMCGTGELPVDGQMSVLSERHGYYFRQHCRTYIRNNGANSAEIVSANQSANF